MNRLAGAIRSVFHYDRTDDVAVIERVQDCEPILERTKALHNAGITHSRDREYVHVASIPKVVVERYCNDNGITFARFMGDEGHQARVLNDPDLRYFRVYKGRV